MLVYMYIYYNISYNIYTLELYWILGFGVTATADSFRNVDCPDASWTLVSSSRSAAFNFTVRSRVLSLLRLAGRKEGGVGTQTRKKIFENLPCGAYIETPAVEPHAGHAHAIEAE